MNSFRLNALRATNEKRPGGNRGATVLELFGSGGPRAQWIVVADPSSHKALQVVNRRAVPMSSQASEHRAQAMRARLSSLAEVCAELGVHLPLRKLLAPAIGATPRQLDRYMAALLAEGVLQHRTHKSAGRIAA